MRSVSTVATFDGAVPLVEAIDFDFLVFGPEVSTVVAGRLEVGVVAHRPNVTREVAA